MIQIKEVTKSFGDLKALDSVTMNIRRGSIYGLVGTNGSGKTTLLKHIAGVLREDGGSICIDDAQIYENSEAKKKVCFIPDELYFFGNYNLNDMSRLFGKVYDSWDQERFDKLVDHFDLDRKLKIIRFSKGMQKQAAFCLAISAMPEYLILDEPVDGLDPLVRRTVWDIIVNDVAEREMAVLISSHNLKEIEGICDTVGILSAGSLILERDLDDLRSNVHKVQVAYTEKPEGEPYKGLNVLKSNAVGSIDMMIIRNSVEEISEALEKYRPAVLDILPLTLEEIFIYELGGENNEYQDILS